MWHSLNKIIGKEKNPFFFKNQKLFSLLTQQNRKIQKLSLSLTQPSSSLLSSTIVAQQSSNIWGFAIWSREARLYVWDFEISGLGRLLPLLIFVGMGCWEIWWVVLLVFCFMMIICEGTCWKHVELAMFGWVKLTHSVFMMMLVMFMCWNCSWKAVRDEG